MKAEWKIFLVHNGAECDNGSVKSFGNAVRELRMVLPGDVFADLSHDGFISVYGDDAASFLQGQLSNDISRVSEQTSQLNSYCTPKGRMLAIFRVYRRGSTYYLRMPRELIDTVIQRLRMFVLRAQVTVDDASETFVGLGVSGPEAPGLVESATGLLAAELEDVAQDDSLMVARIPGPQPRFEIFGSLEAMQKTWEALNVHAGTVGKDAWQLLDVLAGIPVLYPETSEAFVPQMVNLQLVNGLSFKKGCYPGQEIVARMQYLGKLKRRMYLARVESGQRPLPGTALLPCGKSDAQAVGQVVNCLPHPDGGFAMLAVLQIAEAGQQICIDEPKPQPITVASLPYAWETEQ